MENLQIFKNTYKEAGTQQPDYKISGREGDTFVDVGAAWIKQGKKGPYLSVKFKDGYQLTKVSSTAQPVQQEVAEEQGKVVDYPNEDINVDDIPF